MAFKFRLQSVLNHRLHLEDIAKNELGMRVQARNQCEQRILWLREEMGRVRRELAQKEQQGMNANDFIQANEYVTVLRLQALREQSKLPALQSDEGEARSMLLKAVQNRKALEVLLRRDKEDYDYAAMAREQALLDEAAASVYMREAS
jgi:flagellar FliJ protein